MPYQKIDPCILLRINRLGGWCIPCNKTFVLKENNLLSRNYCCARTTDATSWNQNWLNFVSVAVCLIQFSSASRRKTKKIGRFRVQLRCSLYRPNDRKTKQERQLSLYCPLLFGAHFNDPIRGAFSSRHPCPKLCNFNRKTRPRDRSLLQRFAFGDSYRVMVYARDRVGIRLGNLLNGVFTQANFLNSGLLSNTVQIHIFLPKKVLTRFS